MENENPNEYSLDDLLRQIKLSRKLIEYATNSSISGKKLEILSQEEIIEYENIIRANTEIIAFCEKEILKRRNK